MEATERKPARKPSSVSYNLSLQIDNKTEGKLSPEGQSRPLERATPLEPTGRRQTVADHWLGAAAWEQSQRGDGGKKETQRAIDRETHKQRRALSRQGAADRKRHTGAEEGLRAAAGAELS